MVRFIPSIIICLSVLFSSTDLSALAPGKAGTIILKGEDFPAEKTTELSCTDSGECVHFVDEIKKTVQLKLAAFMGDKTLNIEIEIPATMGSHKIKLDKDGDQKPGEKFYLEILGQNPAVDKVVYTLEDERDDATIIITDISEENGTLTGSFSGRFFDAATAVKRVQVNGTFFINDNKSGK